MASYKVLQDIEAEDKLVGPLSLRQFIYAGISALSFYLCFLAVTKHLAFFTVLFLPVGIFTGFFAFPWGRDQPTEVWALAKIRFLLKPRIRIWNQSGVKELVTITVPKRIERELTNGLSQTEVHSRLRALADTIDSRGWAVKNVNVNLMNAQVAEVGASDRLVGIGSFPMEVSNVDVLASDDILDEAANPVAHHFDDMINASTQAHRQQLMAQMQAPTPPPQPVQEPTPPATPLPQTPPTPSPAPTNDYWFMNQPNPAAGQAAFVNAAVVTPGTSALPPTIPQAAMPTPEEQAMVEKFKAENASFEKAANGHIKTILPLADQQAQAAAVAAEQAAAQAAAKAAKPAVTPVSQAAIMNLAHNDDLDVATLARQAHKAAEGNADEVVISLR